MGGAPGWHRRRPASAWASAHPLAPAARCRCCARGHRRDLAARAVGGRALRCPHLALSAAEPGDGRLCAPVRPRGDRLVAPSRGARCRIRSGRTRALLLAPPADRRLLPRAEAALRAHLVHRPSGRCRGVAVGRGRRPLGMGRARGGLPCERLGPGAGAAAGGARGRSARPARAGRAGGRLRRRRFGARRGAASEPPVALPRELDCDGLDSGRARRGHAAGIRGRRRSAAAPRPRSRGLPWPC